MDFNISKERSLIAENRSFSLKKNHFPVLGQNWVSYDQKQIFLGENFVSFWALTGSIFFFSKILFDLFSDIKDLHRGQTPKLASL